METEKALFNASLVFLTTPTHLGLGRKKLKIGAGLYNGVGGGIEEGEDALMSAVREAKEEWDITLYPQELTKVAVVDFHNRKSDGDVFTCRVHTYFARSWVGEPKESPELGPAEWFPRDALPLQEMMLADRDWIPRIAAGETIYAEAWYGPKQQTLERESIVIPTPLASLPTT